MSDDNLYISNLHKEIGNFVYMACKDEASSLRAISAMLATRDDNYASAYQYWSRGNKNPMAQKRPMGNETKLVEARIPASVRNVMERFGVPIRKWAHFYGWNIEFMIENWANGANGDLIFLRLNEDFPVFCMMQKFDDYTMPDIHPLLDPIDCVYSKGKACFSVTSRNFPEIRMFGENRAKQVSQAKYMHYLIIQRERLLVYISTEGTNGERIKAVQEWKPEIIEPHKYGFQYEFPKWSKFSDNKAIFESNIYVLELQISKAKDVDLVCQLKLELEAKKNEFERNVRMVNFPSFRNTEVQNFWDRHVDGIKNELERNIIREILDLLDKEGDCPSVVDKNPKEGERQLPRNNYEVLAKITLLQHSLNVAELMAAEKSSLHLKGHNIITGLGHDLGKIPGIYKYHYKSSTHPFLSKELLNKMRYFPQYPLKDEILKSIAGHHPSYDPSKISDRWVRTLVECDHKARAMELARVSE